MKSTFCDITLIRKTEVCENVKWNEMSDINSKMYQILIEWIVALNKTMKYHIRTLFLAVRLISLLLNRKVDIRRSELQLYGMTCLYISAKLEEVSVGNVQQYITMSDDAYTKEQMIEAEKDIVRILKRIKYPTIYDFLQILSGCDCNTYIIYLGIVSLTCVEILEYSQEDIASALMFLTNRNTSIAKHAWNCSSVLYEHYKQIDQTSDICTRYSKMNPIGSWSLAFRLLCLPIQSLQTVERNKSTNPETTNFYLIPPKSCSSDTKIGEGTYGVVRKVRRKGEYFAMKKSCSDEDGLSTSFLREINVYTLFSIINSEQITSCVGFYLDNKKEYLFVEYASQRDLKSFLNLNWTYFNNTIKLLEASKQLCRGLELMHRLGITHRDIKPQNILVFGTYEKLVLKYCDFGMSRTPGPMVKAGKIGTNYGGFTDVITTLWYRPPEVLSYYKSGSIVYGHEVDMWSLACVLGEMITNKAVFQASDEQEQIACIISYNLDNVLEFSKEYTLQIDFSCMERKELTFPNTITPQLEEVIRGGLNILPKRRMTAKEAVEVLTCCSPMKVD